MEIFENDQNTNEEQNLIEELISNYTNDGKEIDLIVSAHIFHKLGVLHLRRSANTYSIESMPCLIKSAIMLNAALVRTDDDSDTKLIKHDLNQLFQHLLRAAGAENKNVDLLEKFAKPKRRFARMRNCVNEKLSGIPVITKSKSENMRNEQEQEKVKVIKTLQSQIAADYTDIMANIAEDCEQIMGKAPCNFAIIGMGSLARKEITPYSDFEHIIVLGTNDDSHNESKFNYFQWFLVIFQVILINMGEASIPNILNETNSKLRSKYYDRITTRGICFDAMLSWGPTIVLGRPETKNKPWTSEFIKSVPDMLKYLNDNEICENGYHLGDILTKTCYVYGDHSLYNQFESGATDILNKQNENIKTEVLSQIKNDLENYAIRSVLSKITNEGKYNVKKDIYRVTTLFIAALGRLNKISKPSCFQIVEELEKIQAISTDAKNKLTYAIAIACEIRLKWYMNQKQHNDEIRDKSATKLLKESVGETSVIDYFQIAYALQCDISKKFDLKKGHFYSHPDLLNIKIYGIFGTNKETRSIVESFAANPKEHERLLDFDTCLNMLQKEQSTSLYKQLLSIITPDFVCKIVLGYKLQEIGRYLYRTQKYSDSKECFETLLQIEKQISLYVDMDKYVAISLDDIGRCLLEMNQLIEAKEYFEKALKIEKQMSPDVDKDKNMAVSLDDIGRCLLEMNQLIEAKEYFEKALIIEKQMSPDVDKYKNMAISLRNIGRCLLEMNKLTEAKEYLEKALKIFEQIPFDVDKDESIAKTWHLIGRYLLETNQLTEAKEYFEKALKIQKRVSPDIDKDKNVANSLHFIGLCFIHMNKLTEAKEYLENALKIQKQISLDINNNKNVATTLHSIGRCFVEMNKLTEAKAYFENALKMEKQLLHDFD